MALPLIAEAALSSCFQVLLPDLGPILCSKGLCNVWGVGAELKELEKQLASIQDVLNDADRRFHEKCVSMWMDDLREVANDMGDVVDAMNIEPLRLEQQANRHHQVPFNIMIKIKDKQNLT